MKNIAKAATIASLFFGAAWLYTKSKKLERGFELLRFGQPRVDDLNLSGGNVSFKLSLPIDNPIDQSFSGKLLSIRIYSGETLMAYSSPGVIEFTVPAASQASIERVPMTVPLNQVTSLITAQSGGSLLYEADLELGGVRVTYQDMFNLN